MSVTRRNYGRGHSYKVDGQKVPGVTTILNQALPKPALIDWAGRTTAGYAIDYWDELAELSPSKRLDRLNKARFEEKDAAANRGTEVHKLGAALVVGDEVDVPDELAGHVDSYVDFLNTWEPSPVLVETVIANKTVGYCGTLDLVADLGEVRWLLDLKTSKSGIFGETAFQCCAYARAEIYVDADGVEHDMAELGIARCGAVHIRSDGWELRPLETGEDVWQFFRHLRWVARHVEDVPEFVGPAIRPLRAVAS